MNLTLITEDCRNRRGDLVCAPMTFEAAKLHEFPVFAGLGESVIG